MVVVAPAVAVVVVVADAVVVLRWTRLHQSFELTFNQTPHRQEQKVETEKRGDRAERERATRKEQRGRGQGMVAHR